ncbi:C40 family peptidase [Streptomyces sp. NBC_00096]|uniref:C40 family peptidase n=1 Tax=Streptomyces sp. NBC_00096 TaxID=2975650 RepID=UPI003252DBCD
MIETTDNTNWRPHSPPRKRPLSGRHRKPTGRLGLIALRTGVTTGVLGTVAAVSPVTAFSDENSTNDGAVTMEMDLNALFRSHSSVTAEALRESAEVHARQAAEAKAEAKAAKEKAAREKAAKKKAAEEKAAREKAAKAKAAKEKAAREKAARAKAAKAAKPTALPEAPPPGKAAATAVAFARAQMGELYIMGGTGSGGWDCSGLVQAAYEKAGIKLPRVSQHQSTAGTRVSLKALRPGDILYWGGRGSAYHVAIYIGGGKYIGAQNPSVGVVERTMKYDPPSGAVRVA